MGIGEGAPPPTMARLVTATLLFIAALALVASSSAQSLDTSFGGDGFSDLARVGFPLTVTDLETDASGRVLFVVNDGVASGGTASVGRLLENGSLDTGFAGGYATVDRDGPRETLQRVSITTSGDIVAAGSAFTIAPGSLQQSALLVRFASGGGSQNSWTYRFGDRTEATDVAVLDGGNAHALSLTIGPVGQSQCAVLLVDSTGSPIDSFGDDGLSTLPFQGNCEAAGVEASGDGVFVGGTRTEGDRDLFIARIRADGTLDPAFGFGGIDARGFDDAEEYASDLSLGPDGDVLLAGLGEKDDLIGIVLLRLNADGSPDELGDNGFVFATEPTSSHPISGVSPTGSNSTSASIDTSGAVIVATTTRDPQRLTLVRFQPSGDLDTSFGEVGFARLPVPDSPAGSAVGLAISTDSNGRTVFGGTYSTVSNSDKPVVGRLVAPGGGTTTEPPPDDADLVLDVWPNPTRDTATLTPEASGEVSVVDALGREVYRVRVLLGETVVLPAARWAPGLYTVTLTTRDARQVSRLTVSR